MNKKNGIFLTADTLNNSIILEWKIIQGGSDTLNEKIKSLSEILAPSYAQTEVDFARKKPEAVLTDFMLKSLASQLESGVEKVDWDLFHKKVETHLKQFFTTMDWKKSSGTSDVHFFIIAKDKTTSKPLGMIQFFTTPEFEKGTIKAALSGVIPTAQNRGLEKILMSSIFKLQPETKRIFLHTRSTNSNAISSYKEWGFTEFNGSIPNWTDLEYFTNQVNTLQDTSKSLD